MSLILTNSQNYSDIASAIRTKKNVTTTYQPNEMAEAINSIVTDPTLQTKTATPSTSAQDITPDTGYDGLSKVTVSAMPVGVLSTPTVNGQGLVTAAVNTSGYLASGTSKTLQLTKQAGKVVTPGTTQQTAVSSGSYTTGTVYVAGDADLVAANIKSGVNIFGVAGSLQTIGGNGLTWSQLTSQTWGVLARRNIFNLAFCQFEPEITSHVDIDDYGSTFTIRAGSTTGNSVYFMLDPDATYDISWTSQNCVLFGYSDSWDTVISGNSNNGQHSLTNVTNAHYCYFSVYNTSLSLTGTFQDVKIYET